METARGAAPTGQPRIPLSRERVLRAAMVLADRAGVESLTMRKLARELGVEAMSLYNHVANKDDILDGIVEIVFGEIELPASGTDWRAAMRLRAISTREALARHRWAVGLMESRMSPGPANVRLHDAMLGCLRQAGFSVEMAVHAYSVQDSYIYGFALQEKGFAGQKDRLPADEESLSGTLVRELPADEYPYIAEVVGGYVTGPDFQLADEFEFGLDLILDALEGLRGGD
ncbi:MAG TPA: TetR/AcrR family transcriptional regulator C-terminal domain-containing protein [Solirubrobacteraceae bacterium]|jgi:AcrR family transcriptional regulator|nr:TetR/AcrR family transcriptional regulator C-terminal domain-containing protein [Solirubrobacteraceae bacterium]